VPTFTAFCIQSHTSGPPLGRLVSDEVLDEELDEVEESSSTDPKARKMKILSEIIDKNVLTFFIRIVLVNNYCFFYKL
jgi:hypothetical protein